MTDPTSPPFPPSAPRGPRKLRRSTKDSIVAGVAGGVAEYLDIDATAVRFGFVAASLLLAGLGGPLLYLLAWAIVPEEGKDVSLAAETLQAKPWQQWGHHPGGANPTAP